MNPTLTSNVRRHAIHLRRITCEGFKRDDGLFDIEGTLIDTKPFDVELPEKHVPTCAAIHHMVLRLTIDRQWTISDAVANTLHGPYGTCGEITDSYRQLIGLRIEAGFTRKVKQMFRGPLGCSHLTELLPPMATTAFQMLWSEHDGPASTAAASNKANASPLGGCHVLRVRRSGCQTAFQSPVQMSVAQAGVLVERDGPASGRG